MQSFKVSEGFTGQRVLMEVTACRHTTLKVLVFLNVLYSPESLVCLKSGKSLKQIQTCCDPFLKISILLQRSYFYILVYQ